MLLSEPFIKQAFREFKIIVPNAFNAAWNKISCKLINKDLYLYNIFAHF